MLAPRGVGQFGGRFFSTNMARVLRIVPCPRLWQWCRNHLPFTISLPHLPSMQVQQVLHPFFLLGIITIHADLDVPRFGVARHPSTCVEARRGVASGSAMHDCENLPPNQDPTGASSRPIPPSYDHAHSHGAHESDEGHCHDQGRYCRKLGREV